MKSKSTVFVLNRPYLCFAWEVRKLLMPLITPGVDSVCFNVSRLQHRCSWCSVMAVVQHNAVG